MFKLYGNNELIGNYSTRQLAAIDAYELMLDGTLQTFEIIELPQIPQNSLNSIRIEKKMPE